MAGSGVLASRAHVVDTRRALMPARLAAPRMSVAEKLAPWPADWRRRCAGSAGRAEKRAQHHQAGGPGADPGRAVGGGCVPFVRVWAGAAVGGDVASG